MRARRKPDRPVRPGSQLLMVNATAFAFIGNYTKPDKTLATARFLVYIIDPGAGAIHVSQGTRQKRPPGHFRDGTVQDVPDEAAARKWLEDIRLAWKVSVICPHCGL